MADTWISLHPPFGGLPPSLSGYPLSWPPLPRQEHGLWTGPQLKVTLTSLPRTGCREQREIKALLLGTQKNSQHCPRGLPIQLIPWTVSTWKNWGTEGLSQDSERHIYSS